MAKRQRYKVTKNWLGNQMGFWRMLNVTDSKRKTRGPMNWNIKLFRK